MRSPRTFSPPLVAVAVAAISLTSLAQERDRAQIPDQYKWNLADIYQTDAAWRASKDKLQAALPELGQFKGKMASSASALADALDKLYSNGGAYEFEVRMHEMAQKGQPLTGDALSKLYMDITKRYYGHDQGVCVVDDYIASEWSYIPHFYRDFYVFQYATSFAASAALAEKVKAGDPDARRRYLAFLAAGGSKYPIDLLKDAGVDMTTDEPLTLTMKEMNRVMDEIDKLLASRPSTAPR